MKHRLLPFSILFSILFLTTEILSAQNFEWAKRMGGANPDIVNSIALDADGNVYTLGYFNGTADFDPDTSLFNLTSAGGINIFVSKLDALGNFIWAKRMGGPGTASASAIYVDSSGNIYITGAFSNTVDFDPNAGVFNLTSTGRGDIFISKLDSSGNFIWAKRMGGIGTASASAICVDGTGNIYITGDFSDTVDFDPDSSIFNLTTAGLNDYNIFISKLDSSGKFTWAKQMVGIGRDNSISLAIDASGNVYTTGGFSNTVDFDPGIGSYNLTSAGLFDNFISKLDASGNFIWAKKWGGMWQDQSVSIALDTAGNIYTTGSFTSTVDFDPGTGTFNLTSVGVGNFDTFISKLDASGNFIWAKQISGKTAGYNFSNSITLDDTGNIYISGFFKDTADFDTGPGTYDLISTGIEDGFINKLDASGNLIWVKQIESTSRVVRNSITTDQIGNIYVSGIFDGTADFNPGTGIFNLTSAGSWDIYVNKLGVCPNLTSTDSLTACNSYTWIDNMTYTSSTDTPSVTLINSLGCDSVVILDLTINSIDTSITINNDTLNANQQGAAYQWLSCDSNFQVINGDTSQAFIAAMNGNYACEITLNGCVDTTSCVSLMITGVAEKLQQSKIKIYPNPVGNILSIEMVQATQNTSINISDVKGQVVYAKQNLQKGKTQIDASTWAKGLYFVRIIGDDFNESIKILRN